MTAYRLVLPFQRPPMTANQARASKHWSEQADAKQAVEKAAWALAKQQHIPRLGCCIVALVWYPPAQRRKRDGDGLGVMAKAAVDGLRLAGVLDDDDSDHVAWVLLRVAEHDGTARVELIVVDEVPEFFAELLAA